MTEPPMPDDNSVTEVELSRLADGSLPGAARDSVRRRVAASPELAARLADQSRAVALMRSTDAVTAPQALRASVEQMTGASQSTARPARRLRSPGPLRRRAWLPIPVAAAIAAAVVIAVLLSGRASPTVGQTEHLALAAARIPAPGPDAADRDVLDIDGAGIAFPSYLRTANWSAVGARRDTLHGRHVTTVFYRASDGARVGYSIVSGAALSYPSGRSLHAGGLRYVLSTHGGAALVTWRRQGRTCLIAGRGVSERTVLGLAVADNNHPLS